MLLREDSSGFLPDLLEAIDVRSIVHGLVAAAILLAAGLLARAWRRTLERKFPDAEQGDQAKLGVYVRTGRIVILVPAIFIALHVVGVEPAEAPYYRTGEFRQHRIPGVVPGFTPANYDADLVDEILDVPAEAAWETVRELARSEGLLVGISSGATAWAARELAGRPAFAGELIVCVIADTGQRYLSTPGLFER